MTQNHIIKKQLFDIILDSEIGSFTFQNKVGELFKAEIIPLVDAYCSRISDGLETIRIDRLEIDLGTIRRDNFERDFTKKVAELFPKKLMEALRRDRDPYFSDISGGDTSSKRTVTPEIREGEVLEFFLKNGRAPWWVNRSEIYDIPALLESYVTKQPVRMKNLIAGIAGHPDQVKRLVYYAGEPALAKISALFGQDYQMLKQLSGDLIPVFTRCPLLALDDPAKIRAEVWAGILSLMAVSPEQALNRKHMIQNLAGQIAATFGVNYTALYHYIVKDIETKGYGVDDQSLLPKISDKTITNHAQQFENIAKLLQELQMRLMSRNVPADATSIAQPVLDKLLNQISGIIKSIQAIHDPIHDLVIKTGDEKMLEQTKELVADIKKLRHDLGIIFKENRLGVEHDLVKKIVDSMESITEREFRGEELTHTDTFSVSEEIYEHYAGLVLLWPYLAKFFGNLGLLADHRFVNKTANERAVKLLHYLGSGAGEAPEYELMLAKILCGIDPAASISPFFTIKETEIKECESLLQSMIYNWPVLKNVTLPGVRSMFLKREGIIGIRDGHWVLKVEEQALDVLLDKMPWGINTVKLPWMPELLFVEWRL